MVLEFCPVCRNLLQIRNENGKVIGVCSCGFKRMQGIELSSVDKNKDIKTKTGEGIISENTKFEEVNHICKKCSYNEAEVSQIAASESVIFIFKCLKCGHSEREMQGTSKF